LNTLVKPRAPIPPEASRVNGIYDHDVADAPSFLEIYPRLLRHLAGQPVVAYNYTFERDILAICVGRFGLRLAIKEWACAMRDYTKFTGAGRYSKLANACVQEGIIVTGAHRALADCLMTLELMRRMAYG
jgi:DNA polymerase-3 subunit epsilon